MSEDLLRYWREDPLLNDHHWHWHLVYPYAGKADRKKYTTEQLLAFSHKKAKATFLVWNDRHGELFAYMHWQLLARYAAERISVGLAPLQPFDDYRSPIAEGYDPGVALTLDGHRLQVSGRPDGAQLADLVLPNKWSSRPGAKLADQEMFRDRLKAALASSSSANRPTSLSELAERVEPTERFASPYFGALHNDGHLLISMYHNDDGVPGVLFYEESAVRDPVFYRWHAHIDELFQQYEDQKGAQSFSDLSPVETDGFAIVSDSGARNTINTSMRSRVIAPGSVNQATIDYLAHEDSGMSSGQQTP